MTRFVPTILWLCCATAALAGMSGCREAAAINPAPDVKLAEKLREGVGVAAASEPGDDKAAQSTGAGWGTLKGKFVYSGDPPAPSFIPVSKDPDVCGQQVPNEQLIVDSGTKGISNILVFARKVPRVYKPDDGAVAAAPAVFDQKNCIFLTHVLATQTKTPLEFKNSDSVSHNTSFTPGGLNEGVNPMLPQNGTSMYKFGQPMASPAPATCSIHPWMKAYIIARDDPYFALSAKDGTFEIKNLPAGEEIEFQVWHELATGGLAAKPAWAKGRFKLKVPADGVEDLQAVEVPAAAFH